MPFTQGQLHVTTGREQGDIALTKKDDLGTLADQLSQLIGSTAPGINSGGRFRHHREQQRQPLLFRLQPTLSNGERHPRASLPAYGISHHICKLHGPKSSNREQLRISRAYTHKREARRRWP